MMLELTDLARLYLSIPVVGLLLSLAALLAYRWARSLRRHTGSPS